MPIEPYTLEQAEEDVATLRGQVDRMNEVIGTGGPIQVNISLTATDPINGGPETWHSLGTLAGYTVNAGRYRLTPMNEVELDIDVTAGGANAGTVTFQNALPSQYRQTPARGDVRLPMSTTRVVTAGDPWPRLFISQSSGQIEVIQTASDTSELTFTGCMPLD